MSSQKEKLAIGIAVFSVLCSAVSIGLSVVRHTTAGEPDKQRALDVAAAYGFEDAKVMAVMQSWFTPNRCGRGDHVAYDMDARNAKGASVVFTVCCGYPDEDGKGCTVNF